MQIEQTLANYNGNPQTQDGYTKIANELLEAIILFKFTERQYKVFFTILRKTYGFNKVNDDISLSQLSKTCNLPINHISSVLKQLVELNIIIKKEGKHAFNLSINKHYDNWGLHNMECLNMELHKEDKRVPPLGQKGFHNMALQKTTPKDNTKESNLLPDFIPIDLWNEFISMRKKIKKPMTAYAEKLMIKKLTKSHDNKFNIIMMIENSILNSWQNIYEPDKNNSDSQKEKLKMEFI